MIVHIGFPITDIRSFSEQDTGRLPNPVWPIPKPYKDFIRSTGQVRVRSRGGLANWVGENSVCSARQMIKLVGPPVIRDKSTHMNPPVFCAARHFYFDGQAVGKLEIVFKVSDSRWTAGKNITEICHQILDLDVRIKIPSGETNQTKLHLAGRALAAKYTYASSYTHDYPSLAGRKWVSGGEPVILVMLDKREARLNGLPVKKLNLAKNLGLDLYHIWQKEGGNRYQVWIMVYRNTDEKTKTFARCLRICLMRLNAEYAGLRFVVKALSSGEIAPRAGSKASESLQLYLRDSTGHISKMSKELNAFYNAGEIEQVALSLLDETNPGERDELLRALKIANIRPQLYKKVERIVNQTFIEEVNIMRDQYNVSGGQVGNVGPGGQLHDINFNQVWLDHKANIDLEKLSGELALMRARMKEEAQTPEQDVAVADVAMAEVAAKNGDGPKAIEFLKKAGKWALEIAQKVGVNLATEAIKIALGLKMP